MAVEQPGAEASPAPEAAREDPAEEVPAQDDLDETKRKFREALERKRGTHGSAQGADHTGKVHGSHGPAASRRSFRRKSGLPRPLQQSTARPPGLLTPPVLAPGAVLIRRGGTGGGRARLRPGWLYRRRPELGEPGAARAARRLRDPAP